MSQDATPVPKDLRALIGQVQLGRLALPEFQRDFRWKPKAIAEFLMTVGRNWPAGSFLLLRGPQQFGTKALQGAPSYSTYPDLLILDGQQRMTAAYQALLDQDDETYFVNMEPLLRGEEFEDEHLVFMKKTKFSKIFPSDVKMAAARVVKVSTLWEDEALQRWARYLPTEAERDQVFGIRNSKLPGFKAYTIPCVVLEPDVDIRALAKIFETINRTGVRLDAFDLMVAKLYPSGFNLREKWTAAREKFPELTEFKVEGIEVLKWIALGEHLRQVDERTHAKLAGTAQPKRVAVGGVRESDVLNLTPTVVMQKWDDALAAYQAALRFARKHCGVVRPSFIPAEAMILPLADVLAPAVGTRPGFERDLTRWFWATAFAQSYAQGSNTQAISDARALRAWRQDAAAAPKVLEKFGSGGGSGDTVDWAEVLQDECRRNETFVRALACLLVSRDCRDWIEQVRLADTRDDLEIHHCFPEEYLATIGIKEADLVANVTPILASTNKKIRSDPPSAVANRQDVQRVNVEGHAIDWDLYSGQSWTEFLKSRAKKLHGLITAATRAT